MKKTRTLFALAVLAGPLLGTGCKKEAPPASPAETSTRARRSHAFPSTRSTTQHPRT